MADDVRKAVLSTTISQIPKLLQDGGKTLVRLFTSGSLDISGISGAMRLFNQSILPTWATEAHQMWSLLAKRGKQSVGLAAEVGVDTISELQSVLAETPDFGKTVFIVSNLVHVLGVPIFASILSEMDVPDLDLKFENQSRGVIFSTYSPVAIHLDLQRIIKSRSEHLEQLIIAALSAGVGPGDIERDNWKTGKSPDPNGLLKSKLLASVLSVSRFDEATPIQYPVIVKHINYVVALAAMFEFTLKYNGTTIVEGSDKEIILTDIGDFQQGEEIILKISNLISSEVAEGTFEYSNLRDLYTQAKISLMGAKNVQIQQVLETLNEIMRNDNEICKFEEIRLNACRATIDVLQSIQFGPETRLDMAGDYIEDEVRMIWFLEILSRSVSGDISSLGVRVDDAYKYLRKFEESSAAKIGEWAESLWSFLRVLNPHSQMDTPFSTIIGGQVGVIVPSLILLKSETELLACSTPLTIIPGALLVRGKQQELLSEQPPSWRKPLRGDQVDKSTRPKCIWTNVKHTITLLGKHPDYYYKVYADSYGIHIGRATEAWMQSVNGNALESAVDAPDYVCRNVDSVHLTSIYKTATVWQAHKSLAGKLLVLTTLGDLRYADVHWVEEVSTVIKAREAGYIFVREQESIWKARKKAAAIDARHILV